MRPRLASLGARCAGGGDGGRGRAPHLELAVEEVAHALHLLPVRMPLRGRRGRLVVPAAHPHVSAFRRNGGGR